jgi:hypothetical protein
MLTTSISPLPLPPRRLLDRAREALLQIDGKLQSSGSGNLKTTYVNQLSCINSVTEHMAVGIAAVYPTWRTLLNAYNACANVREKELMLQDIPVRLLLPCASLRFHDLVG